MTGTSADIYVGIMSGTSLDGIDVSICRFDISSTPPSIDLLAHHTYDWPRDQREVLREVVSADTYSVNDLTRLNFDLSKTYASCVLSSLKAKGLQAFDIKAIGLHGQTIRHLPAHGATWQIASGPALAALTSIDVVHDFRSADVALGGQGAPLVPMFDRIFLHSPERDRLVTNIGGISNVTFIPKSGRKEDVVAYDTGPGNMIIDWLANEYLGKPFDENGVAASRGRVDEAVITSLLAHEYFKQPPPKSTGRELMQRDFIPVLQYAVDNGQLTVEDAMATATELTARTLASAAANSDLDLILSGGGAKNAFLVSRIKQQLPSSRVLLSNEVGIDPQAKESVAFAFFAKAFTDRHIIHLPRTTGASRAVVLGSVSLGG